MSSLSLKDFLTERFGKRTTGQGILNSMTTGMENARASTSSPDEQAHIKQQQARREQIRPDGSFLYTALYDGKQNVQILRPMEELRRFCVAKGGTFTVLGRYDPEEIDRIFERRAVNAIREGNEADAQAQAMGAGETHIALQGAGHIGHLDRIEDRRGATAGYRAAARKPALGDGTCAHPSRADASWTVNVRAVYFEPYNPQSSVKLHELDLRIAQVQAEAGLAPRPAE